MKQDGTRLKNKTPQEILNMDRKSELKTLCSEGYFSIIKLNGMSALQEKQYLAKQQTIKVLLTNSHEYPPL